MRNHLPHCKTIPLVSLFAVMVGFASYDFPASLCSVSVTVTRNNSRSIRKVGVSRERIDIMQED